MSKLIFLSIVMIEPKLKMKVFKVETYDQKGNFISKEIKVYKPRIQNKKTLVCPPPSQKCKECTLICIH